MRKRTFKFIVTVLAFAMSFAAAKTITPKTPKQESDGKKCYLIGSAEELYGFAGVVAAQQSFVCAKLTADIVVNEHVLKDEKGKSNVASDGRYVGDASDFVEWTSLADNDGRFFGHIYGQNHTISGLYGSNGLIEAAYGSGDRIVIDGLGIVDSYIQGSADVGLFVGRAYGCSMSISNSFAEGVVKGLSGIGGFVGTLWNMDDLTISNSTNRASVFSSRNAGGFLGSASDGGSLKIQDSENEGSVSTSSEYAGGFAGWFRMDDSLVIVNSINSGIVNGYDYVGGFVGANYAETYIENSSNVANVQGRSYVGGFIGADFNMAENKTLINLGVSKHSVEGFEFVGGLVGWSEEKKLVIDGVSNKANVQGSLKVGGFVGFFNGSFDRDSLIFRNSINKGVVEGDSAVGGFLGYAAFNSLILFNNSTNENNVVGVKNVGGLAGYTDVSRIFANTVTNNGDVEGVTNVGGLLGFPDGESEVRVDNILNTGNVSGTSVVGGFFGKTHCLNLYAFASLNIGTVSGKSAVGNITGYLETYEGRIEEVYFVMKNLASTGEISEFLQVYEAERGKTFFFDNSKLVGEGELENGYVAYHLHDYVGFYGADGSIWGQSVADGDPYPTFTGKVIFPIIAEFNGGSCWMPVDRYVYGEITGIQLPSREEHYFRGWYLTPDFEEGTQISVIDSVTTFAVYVYAKFVPYHPDTVATDTIPGDTITKDTVPTDTIPTDTIVPVVNKCIAFVNGFGNYGEHCYNSGLQNMEDGACYAKNVDRIDENPQWISENALDAWWWTKVSCDGSEPPAETSTCVAFVNGKGNYGEHCYKSGLQNMEEGACYAKNADRSDENPQWISENALDSWWWTKVSCENGEAPKAPESPACIAFVNGKGGYSERCYKSGLNNMETGACYELNANRKAEGFNERWMSEDASDAWWWTKVSCVIGYPGYENEDPVNHVDVEEEGSGANNGGLKRASRPANDVKNVAPVVASVEAVKTAKVYDVLGNFLGAERFTGAIADVDLSKYAGKGVMIVRFFEGKGIVATKRVVR